jgi:DNA (cytosine-5)-methyltransferase 1
MTSFPIADLFCGAGGTSTGAVEAIRALGMSPKLTACNHWPVAVATHTANHPDARHFCASLDTLNPRELFAPGELRLLWGSPECTNHSRARRGKHINEQSRATAWCVTRWADALRPDTVLIENVPEFRNWPSFAAWAACLESFGYRVDSRILVAADYGDPTTRRRLFVQAVRGKRRIVWPNPTHAKAGELLGLKSWIPASAIIDWNLPAQSIASRKKPLAAKTMKRIRDGLEKHGGAMIIAMEHGGRSLSIDNPLPTVTCAKGGAFGLAYLLPQHGGGALRPVTEPAPTVACAGAIALIMEYYGTGGTRPVSEPLPTVTCRDRFALIQANGGEILFRMLKGHELAAAQGFRRDYKFTGTGSEITKQIGNAVPRHLARAIVAASVGQSADVGFLAA